MNEFIVLSKRATPMQTIVSANETCESDTKAPPSTPCAADLTPKAEVKSVYVNDSSLLVFPPEAEAKVGFSFGSVTVDCPTICTGNTNSINSISSKIDDATVGCATICAENTLSINNVTSRIDELEKTVSLVQENHDAILGLLDNYEKRMEQRLSKQPKPSYSKSRCCFSFVGHVATYAVTSFVTVWCIVEYSRQSNPVLHHFS